MTQPVRFIALLSLLVLNACSGLPIAGIADQSQIEQWIQQQQYSRAIHALEYRVFGSSPNKDQDFLKQVKQQASSYDKQQAQEVLALQQKDNWKEAFALLYQSRQNYAEGEQLLKAQQTLLHRQTLRKKRLQAQVLLAKAEWLLRNHDMHREITHIDPDNFSAELQLSYARSQLTDAASELYDYGMHAKANNDLELADHCLTMSHRIKPEEKTRQALVELGKIQEERKRQQLEQQAQQLLNEIREALTTADLALANQLIKQADKFEGLNHTAQAFSDLRTSLNSAITAMVNELLKQGDTHYSNGKIKQAKQLWEKALSLDPENIETQERIHRAERVLGKLKQLKETKQRQ